MHQILSWLQILQQLQMQPLRSQYQRELPLPNQWQPELLCQSFLIIRNFAEISTWTLCASSDWITTSARIRAFGWYLSEWVSEKIGDTYRNNSDAGVTIDSIALVTDRQSFIRESAIASVSVTKIVSAKIFIIALNLLEITSWVSRLSWLYLWLYCISQ